jgi:tRNA(adenine34) deaminase
MQQALYLAEKAALLNEVPVGAVLVFDNKVIAEGHNAPISHQDPSAHAEILALRTGAKYLNNYRLPKTTLYVTLEPCLMCAGALVHARIERLVFGAFDQRAGAICSCSGILDASFLNHRVTYTSGVLAAQSAQLLQAFFRARR